MGIVRVKEFEEEFEQEEIEKMKAGFGKVIRNMEKQCKVEH